MSSIRIVFLMLWLPVFASAQNSVGSFDQEFNWDKTNETKTIKVKVEKGADEVNMDFEGSIKEGALFISAYDPDGNKVGGFTLVCSGADGTHIDINSSEGEGVNFTLDPNSNSEYHYHSGNGSNTSTVTSTSTSSNTTTTSDDGNTTVSVTTSNGKSKNKKKRNKSKTKSKSKSKDGKTYSITSTSTSSDSKGAKGIMKKRVDDPTPGVWKFVLEIKDVTGTLTAKIDQD